MNPIKKNFQITVFYLFTYILKEEIYFEFNYFKNKHARVNYLSIIISILIKILKKVY